MSKEITEDHIGLMIRVRNELADEWLERDFVGKCMSKYVCRDPDSHIRLCRWAYAEPIPEKRELKATDLMGWWAIGDGGTIGPIKINSRGQVMIPRNWWDMWDLTEDWKFNKDPFTPLDQWLTIDQVRELKK